MMYLNKLLIVMVLFFSTTSISWSRTGVVVNMNNQYPVYQGTVVRIIDGDTLEVKVDLWPRLKTTYEVRVRGIDAPETHRPACPEERAWGREAKRTVEKLYKVGSQVRLENIALDSFGRAVADISRRRSDRQLYLANELLERGLAVKWTPNMKKVPWCLLAKTR